MGTVAMTSAGGSLSEPGTILVFRDWQLTKQASQTKREILAVLQQMPTLTSGWPGFYLEN